MEGRRTENDNERRLLLLARRFPFNHGEVAAESYLENEIKYLSAYFDEILVVGTEAPKSDELTCALPSNVRALALDCGNAVKDKAILAAKGLTNSCSRFDGLREAYASDPVCGFMQRVFRGYFAARAKRKFDKLSVELEALHFEPSQIYSFWFYDTALVAAWLLKSYPCARAVARAHRYDLYTNRTCVHYLPFRKYLLGKLSKVLPCSEDGANYINIQWPGFEKKVVTSHLGTRELSDKSGELSMNPLQLVSCSRVVDVKRVPMLARAIASLDASGHFVDWTHYGDGPELEEVKKICSSLKGSSVRFPGNLPNEALLDEYESMHFDLFINVSKSEGLPLSIMEACGCGIPVIATDVGGTHEIVSDGVNGYLLPALCSAVDVANAVMRFDAIGDIEKTRMRIASRHVWENGFRISANVKSLVRALGAEPLTGGER
jgi:colanic acid/amylovoran biosynthesis glycosyltransferase